MSQETISAGIAEEDGREKEIYELLHTFRRRDMFLDMSEHLMMAARLSRSLWEALGNVDLDVEPRTRLGLQCLASEVADHASAADVLFQLDSVRKSVAK